MFRRITSASLILLCGWLAVGPLAVMQIGAWGWMLGSYSQESSFEQAVRETFGGERPCDMCELIESVKKEHSTTAEIVISKELKLMLGLAKSIAAQVPEPQKFRFVYPEDHPVKNLERVPTPPPRIV